MKNVKRPIRFPDDFRETVIALNLDPVVFIQRYVDSLSFYPHFSTMSEGEKSSQRRRIISGMMDYQRSGTLLIDTDLYKINLKFCNLLIRLANDYSLSEKQLTQKSKSLIGKWEKNARPLLNYLEEITLEGGGVVRLSFDYLLIHVGSRMKTRANLQGVLRRLSLAVLHAHRYSSEVHNNHKAMDFFAGLYDDPKGVFLASSEIQRNIILEYETRFAALLTTLEPIKFYHKRLVILREFMKEWSGKMMEKEQPSSYDGI
jgi:hypothetical protein